MYESIRIQNFRGLKDLTIENLGRVNLLVGANNVGKTSVLEAIWLFDGAEDPSRVVELANVRDARPTRNALDQAWRGLFRNLRIDDSISISATSKSFGTRQLAIKTSQKLGEIEGLLQQPLFDQDLGGEAPIRTQPVLVFQLTENALIINRAALTVDARSNLYRFGGKSHPSRSTFVAASREFGDSRLAALLTESEDLGKATQVVTDLRIAFPELERLSVGYNGATEKPYVRGFTATQREPIPFYLFGDGPKRLLGFLLAVHSSNTELLFIDEIENGIYYAVHEQVWTSLDRASKASGIQIFATTHSWECVEAALRAFGGDSADEFRLIRLERDGDDVRAITAEHHQVESTVALGFDVR